MGEARGRMVYGCAQLVRERGVSGTGLRDVVARAGAPRGSLQHYFPGGKEQLVREALGWSAGFAAARVREYVDGAAEPTPGSMDRPTPGGTAVPGADRPTPGGTPGPSADQPTPAGLLSALVEQWRVDLTKRGYVAGCPLLAATADVAAADGPLREAVRDGFGTWVGSVRDALRGMGVPADRAGTLALVVISAVEGAIVLARARRDLTPLDAVERELKPLLDGAVP